MVLARQIFSNAAVATAARLLGGVFAFAATALIARILKPEGFGEYATVLAFLYMFQAIADLGLYTTLVREISRPESQERQTVSDIFTLRLIALALLLSIGVAMILLVPQYSETVKSAAPVAALFYFFLSGSQVLMGVFQKYFALRLVAIAELISRAVQLFLVAILFTRGAGLLDILWAMAIATGIHFFLTILFARRFIAFGFGFSLERVRVILTIAIPIGISLVFTLLYFRVDTVLLSLLKPERDVGIYNIAFKLLENTIFYPAMFIGLIMPFLSRAAVNDLERFRYIFQKAFDVIVMCAVPLVIGGMFVAKPIILIFGEPFLDAVLPLKILLVAIGFIFLGSLLGNSVVALDRQREAIWVYFFGMIFNIAANILFIPRYTYIAAAATTALTEAIVIAGLLFLVVQRIGSFPSLRVFGRALLAALILAGALQLTVEPLFLRIGFFSLVPILLAAPILYFSTLYFFGGINKGDLRMLLQKS